MNLAMADETHSELKEASVAYRTTSRFPTLHDSRFPVHKIADQLEPYLRVIVEKFRPQKIVLFGSQAYGQPDEHSDVDLLVVRRGITSEKESNIEIRHALWEVPGPRPSFTFLSKTPEDIAAALAENDPFFEDIIGQGIELYAA
jgi:predicted nucleotidyltransferase